MKNAHKPWVQWTDEQISRLYYLHAVEGKSFAQCEKLISGMSKGACSGKWHRDFGHIELPTKTGQFSLKDDAYIMRKYSDARGGGGYSYARIAEDLGRTETSVTQRRHALLAKAKAKIEADSKRQERIIETKTWAEDNPNRCMAVVTDGDGHDTRCKWPAQRSAGDSGQLCAQCNTARFRSKAEAAA